MWQIIFSSFSLILLFVGFKGRQPLILLILLEVMVLLIFMKIILFSESSCSSPLEMAILFTVSVLSASLGLSIITSLARNHGQILFSGPYL